MNVVQASRQSGTSLLLSVFGVVFFAGVAAAQTPPPAPDQIWFHSRTETSLEISWGKADTATGYQVYEGEPGNYQPRLSISEIDAAANAFDAGISSDLRLAKVGGLECGTIYNFVVGAFNGNGESSSSPELVVNTDTCELLPPILTVPVPGLISPISSTTVLSGTDLLLQWESIQADAYWLEVEGSGDFLIQKYLTNTTSYTLTGLFPGEYFWKVQAETEGIRSEWSPKWKIEVDLLLDPVIDCNTWFGSPSVRVFFETNCSGEYRELPIGKTNLSEVGIDNSVSSIYIPEGLSMRVYWSPDQQGLNSCYAESMWNLALDHYWGTDQVVGNSISSIEVFDNPDCATVGEAPVIQVRTRLPFITN